MVVFRTKQQKARSGCANGCLGNHFSGEDDNDDDDVELLVVGAQKTLRI